MKYPNHLRRLTAVLLTLLLLCGTGAAAGAAGQSGSAGDDAQALSALVAQHWSEEFFSSMTLTAGAPQAVIDGEVHALGSSPRVSGGEALLPAQAVAEVRDIPLSLELQGAEALMTESEAEALGLEVEVLEGGSILVTAPFQTRRLLVKTLPGAAPEASDAAVVLPLGRDRYALQFETEAQARTACTRLSADPKVIYAEPDSIASLDALGWGTDAIAAPAFQAVLPAARETVIVAVLDSGLDSTNALFSGRVTAKQWNFVAGNSNPADDHARGHGTHVSGIVADATPSNVKIMPLKVMHANGSGAASLIIEGLSYAVEHGARVVNMSLSSAYTNRESWAEALSAAAAAGVTVVASAGNDSQSHRSYPASLHNAIAVAASDSTGAPWSGSNYGSWVDIAAPGVKVTSTVPGGYASLTGTSMAAPYVSAAAALVISHSPGVEQKQILPYLQSISTKWSDPTLAQKYGPGVLNLKPRALAEFLPAALTLAPGESTQLQGTVCPPDFTRAFRYTTQLPAVAAASDGGALLALHAGTTSLTVSNGSSSVTLPVTVTGTVDPLTASLSITAMSLTPPAKTDYHPGEALDCAGGSLRLSFSDGSSMEAALLPGYCTGFDPNTPGTQLVTVSLGGLTASFAVTAGERAATLSIETLPDKLIYKQGEALDLTGGSLRLSFADGRSEVLPMGSERVTAARPAEHSEDIGFGYVTLCLDDSAAISYLVAMVNSAGRIDTLVERLDLRYKKDEVNFAIADGAHFTWECSPAGVIAIDAEGTMTCLGTGSTTVSLVLDRPGQTKHTLAQIEVTVSYTFWQWLLVIFLFGWLWL